MIPAGYMAKRVSPRPSSIQHPGVVDVYSVSGCISPDFADYFKAWRHNGYWLFDRREIVGEVARELEVDLAGTATFYYEVLPRQFDSSVGAWTAVVPEAAFPLDVVTPAHKRLAGYDVVTFTAGSSAECSPLSCNALAQDPGIEQFVNEHCLLPSRDVAVELLEGGAFLHGEPGPYRVFAIYTVD